MEDQYYNNMLKGKGIKPAVKDDDDDDEPSPLPFSKKTKKGKSEPTPKVRFFSINVLTMIAGIIIVIVIVLSVMCRGAKKTEKWDWEEGVRNRKGEESTLLSKSSGMSAEKPLTQSVLVSGDDSTPIAVSIPPVNPPEEKSESIFDDDGTPSHVVKTHRRSHVKRVKRSKK